MATFNLTVGIFGGTAVPVLRPDEITMAPITASCLLLVGISLLVMRRARANRWRNALGIACSGTVVAVSAFRLLGWLIGNDSLLDPQSLTTLPEWVRLAGSGTMVPLTALGLSITSTASLLSMVIRQSRTDKWVVLGGLIVAITGIVIVLGNLYASLPLYNRSQIPMARGTGFSLLLAGLGLVAAVGPAGMLFRPLLGHTVKARLLRIFLPYAPLVVVISDSLTLLAATLFSPASSALTSAVSVALATAVAVGLCAFLAGHLGRRLERAESELRQANDLLEIRVRNRTRDLEDAKTQLECKNRQLLQSASDLERTAESERKAHRDLQVAHDDLKRAEAQLVQSEKLASLGQMVAGVAHEMNNPLAFVSNNIEMVDRDVSQLGALIRLYQQNDGLLERHDREQMARIRALADRIELDYVLENLPSMIHRSRGGLKRIQHIIGNLRDFARLDEAEIKEADLNLGIRSTLVLLRSLAEGQGVSLVEDLDPLHPIVCYPAKINQVVLNLVSNAIEASGRGMSVIVATRAEKDGGVRLEVSDSGCGIDPSIRSKIFDPFFTTKPVGQGTGLGLSISYGIVQAHGGTIHVESEVNRGTRFVVHLPAHPPDNQSHEQHAPLTATATALTAEGLR